MPWTPAMPPSPPAVVWQAPAARAATLTPAPVRLPGRLTLSVVEQGPKDGVPVILLHGLTDSWWSWSEVLPLLPADWHVLAPSQRGHGDSDSPAEVSAYTITEFARDVLALLDARGIQRAVVVGHSMGATVAERVAVLAPQRVRGLVLVGATATWATNAGVSEMAGQVARLTDPVDPAFIREFQQSTLAKPVTPAFFEGVLRETAKVKAHTWRGAVAALGTEDSSAQLPSLTMPALILWGDQDGFADRAAQDRLKQALPRARHEAFAGYGHGLHWEAPALVAAQLRAFVGGLPK